MTRTLLVSLLLVVFCSAVRAQETAGRVHTVIISGGMNKLMNYERYLNDCAFLYLTLLHDYHFQKQDITLLISDGGEPGRDMLLADGSGFVSSSVDLDGDGERDVWLPATLPQVEASLTELAASLTPNDRLLLFIVDHGGRDETQQSYACMWGGERLYSSRLAQLLEAFHVESMGIVLGMCYSGGFIDALWQEGRVIATSSAASELSWSCQDRPYDEFVYHWICAIAGHNPEGETVCADSNYDGVVSFAEAFEYARLQDSREETPQYSSTHLSLGDQWTFSQQPSSGILCVNRKEIYDKVFDIQGRPLPTEAASRGKYLKILNVEQSFNPSRIIIIK